MTSSDNLRKILEDASVVFTLAQLDQLVRYQHMVEEWNRKLNLIGSTTVADFPRRHILDSAQLAVFLPSASVEVLDVGSGAGLPGLVLAILCPQHKFTLAEIIQKKASFLTTAAHKLGLANVRVHGGDVKTLPAQTYHVVTARAVAALADLLALSASKLAPGGYWLLLKGEAAEHEINALKSISPGLGDLTITKHPSIVSPAGCVLVIGRAKNA